MSKKANPTAIGSFILGAIALVVVAILLFGKGEWFQPKFRLVMFFTGSVTGLDRGAPVKLRGVPIGKVVSIRASHDPRVAGKEALLIPVVVEIEEGRVTDASTGQPDVSATSKDFTREVQALIDDGLRARLELESLVTGKLYIELDFFPDTPVNLMNLELHHAVMELPTIPSAKEEITAMLEALKGLAKKLAQLDVETINQKTVSVLSGLDEIVNGPEVRQTLTSLSNLVKNMDNRFDTLHTELIAALENAQAALQDARGTLSRTNVLIGDARGLVRSTDNNITAVANSAIDALDQVKAAFRTLQRAIDERSPIRHELTKTMTELSAAARSARALVDYLERHPEALLQGKKSGAR